MTSHNYNSNSGISSTTIPEIWNNEWILLEGKYTRWLPLCQIQLADVFFFVCVHVNSPQSYLTLCNPMDCRFLGYSIHGILQARILEWVAISFSVCVCVCVCVSQYLRQNILQFSTVLSISLCLKFLFIQLHRILVAACRIFVASHRTIDHSYLIPAWFTCLHQFTGLWVFNFVSSDRHSSWREGIGKSNRNKQEE